MQPSRRYREMNKRHPTKEKEQKVWCEMKYSALLCYGTAVDGVCFTAVIKPKSGGSHGLLIAFALFRLLDTEYTLNQQCHL